MASPLDELRDRRKVWIECLNDKSQNSIRSQHLRLLWNVGAYKVVNEARRPKYRPRNRQGEIEVSGLLHALLDDCFFESQLLAVRRITECTSQSDLSKDRDDRGVWALVPLIRDIKAHRHLLTRENVFAVEGRVYDSKAALRESRIAGHGPISSVAIVSERRHKQLDSLAGVRAKDRKSSDTVREAVLKRLIDRLTDRCTHIAKQVDKFVAHAATSFSQGTLGSLAGPVTVGQLWKVHQILHETINFVGENILGAGNFGGLPHPGHDHLMHLDRPLVMTEQIPSLLKQWKRFAKDVHQWEQFSPRQLNAEIRRS